MGDHRNIWNPTMSNKVTSSDTYRPPNKIASVSLLPLKSLKFFLLTNLNIEPIKKGIVGSVVFPSLKAGSSTGMAVSGKWQLILTTDILSHFLTPSARACVCACTHTGADNGPGNLAVTIIQVRSYDFVAAAFLFLVWQRSHPLNTRPLQSMLCRQSQCSLCLHPEQMANYVNNRTAHTPDGRCSPSCFLEFRVSCEHSC